jgi:FKBP-type peptidyl-prolyl cis-trans isomerase FkpA
MNSFIWSLKQNKKKLMQQNNNKIGLHKNKINKMKKWFFLIALSAIIFSSCTKDDATSTTCTTASPTTVAPDSQKVYLQNYLAAKGITNAIEKNGMFYKVDIAGTGENPTVCSTIAISYIGNYINGTNDGTVFDASSPGQPAQFTLSGLITAWQIALPLAKVGSTVTLYVPPALAYGVTGSNNIPPNAYLKFKISLLAFQ